MAKPSRKVIVTLVVEFETEVPSKKDVKAAILEVFMPSEIDGAALWVGSNGTDAYKAIAVRVRDVDLP